MFEYEYGFLPFVKGILIMNGETDYETLFDPEENERASNLEYAIGAHIMFVGFIALMTIILMNLLLGLAITDIQELQKRAELSRTERLIVQVDLLETLFCKGWVPSWLKNYYEEHYSIDSQCGYYNELISKSKEIEDDDEYSEDEEDDGENVKKDGDEKYYVKRFVLKY